MEQYAQMKNSGVSWIQDIPVEWGVRVLFQLVDQVKNKNKDLAEKNLLSLSYGKIKRKDINNPEGLLPESFDGYNIIEADDIVLRLTDLQNDHTGEERVVERCLLGTVSLKSCGWGKNRI